MSLEMFVPCPLFILKTGYEDEDGISVDIYLDEWREQWCILNDWLEALIRWTQSIGAQAFVEEGCNE